MNGKPNKSSDISSGIRAGQTVTGLEKEGERTGGNQFAFAAKLAIIVALVLLAFWLLDRAV